MRNARLPNAVFALLLSPLLRAESVLTTPDLGVLVTEDRNGSVLVTPDRANARYYVHGVFSSINGVRQHSVARVYQNGAVDLGWRIPTIESFRGFALAPNGDVFVADGQSIKRYKTMITTALMGNVSIERTSGYSESFLESIFTDKSGTIRVVVSEYQSGLPSLRRCLPLDPSRNTATNADALNVSFIEPGDECARQLGLAANVVPLASSNLANKVIAGYGATPSRLLPLDDGGLIVVGDFATFENGVIHKNLIRFDARGRIVPSPVIPVDVTVYDAQLDDDQLTVFGRAARGAPFAAAYSLAVNDPRWVNRERTILPNARGNYFFSPVKQQQSTSFIRIEKRSGLVVPGAIGPYAFQDAYAVAAQDDGFGSLWVTSEGFDTFGGQCPYRINRFGIDRPSPSEEAFSPPKFLNGTAILCPDFAIDEYFAYSLNGRLNLRTNTMDAEWSAPFPSRIGTPTFTKNFAYWSVRQSDDTYRMVRAAKLGDGNPDSSWRFPQTPAIDLASLTTLIPMPSASDPDRFLATAYLREPTGGTSLALVDSVPLPTPGAKTVVEYYLPSIDRYFMTGRDDEKAQLDALPSLYVRTGMEFAAIDSTYRNREEQPVCRFYAPASRGSSKTHFYGTGDECAMLKALSAFEYDGYDFSVKQPASGVCPVDAASPVTRLFNNRAATNNTNHRYVVDDVTKQRMLAQGWIDEGVRFCATAARAQSMNAACAQRAAGQC